MVTKKMQGVSSNLFALSRKLPDFIPTASSTFRISPTALALDFPQLLDALGKRLELRINV